MAETQSCAPIANPDADEVWWPIPSYYFYEVSTHGRVRSWKFRKTVPVEPTLLRPSINPRTGYRQVVLSHRGERRTHNVHSLVMAVHGGVRPNEAEVRHLNGDKLDNRRCNLAWGSHQENMDDMRRHGMTAKGSRNGQSRLSELDVLEARRARSSGVPTSQLAELYGVSNSAMAAAIVGRTWGHLSTATVAVNAVANSSL